MNPPGWLAWIPPFAPFLLLLKPALLPAVAWAPVLTGMFGAAAALIWTGGRLLSGQGFAVSARPRTQDVQQQSA
jgi:ABC-type Na+ efflux pump permease subunit